MELEAELSAPRHDAVTTNIVEQHIRRAEKFQSSWTDDKIKQLINLHKEGYSCSQIGALIGVTRNAAIGKLTRLGFGKPRQQLTEEQRQLRLIARREKDAQRKRYNPRRKPILRICPSNGAAKSLRIFETTTGDTLPMRCAAVEPLNVSLMDLTGGMCRFPDGEGASITFCGHRVRKDAPYCPDHCAIAFVPFERRKAA